MTSSWHVITSPADAVRLAGTTTLEGSLVVELGAGPQLALGSLEEVRGDLDIGCPDLTEVKLDRLRHVAGQLVVIGSGLQRVALPALEEVGQCIEIDRNAELMELELPRLRRIGASLIVENNVKLARLGLPKLVSVGMRLVCDGNSALDPAEWRALVSRFSTSV
jgi:hypothetical protein